MEADQAPDADQIVELKEFVVSRIMELDERYNPSTIENMVDKVLGSKEGKEKAGDNIAFMRLVYKRLQDTGKTDMRRASKKKKLSPAQIVSFLEDDE